MTSMIRRFTVFGWILSMCIGELPWASPDSLPVSGQMREIVLPVAVSDSVVIDGSLSESFWRKGVRIDEFVEFLPRQGFRPPVNTTVRLLHDGQNIYVGFVCREKDVSQIRACSRDKDRLGNDDYVGLMFDTFGQLQSAYKFALNACGVQIDGISYPWGETDLTFDTHWEAEAHIFEDRWEAEIKIPFNSLDFPPADEQHWRLYLGRTRPRSSMEEYSWPSISLNSPMFTQLGHLYIRDKIAWRRTVELLPYLVAVREDLFADGENPAPTSQSLGLRVGLTGKYTPFSNLAFDWAVNPVYAQIETDAPQIDVNTTFALFYPEKRPIFMKGSDIFKSPIDVIYTRSMNDPLAALKFTGRFGNTSLGCITSYDKHTPWIVPFRNYSFAVTSEEKSLSSILRVRQSVLEDSYIGAVATSRDVNSGFSRVAGVDGDLRFFHNFVVAFQLLKSWYKEPCDSSIFQGYEWLRFDNHTSAFDSEQFDGFAYRMDFSRYARLFNFGIWHTAFSPTFRADNGFINKNDFTETGGWGNLQFYVNKGILESVVPRINMWQKLDYAGAFWKNYLCSGLTVNFMQQTHLNLYYALSREVFQDMEFNDIWAVDGQLSTDFSKAFSGGVWYQFGKSINYYSLPPTLGSVDNISVWVTLKPVPQFALGFDVERYWLRDDADEEVYDVTILQNKVSYQLTKHLSLRSVVQYESSNKSIGIYPLISFEPTSFTLFYLGSNHDLSGFGKSHGMKETNRQVFVKFQYMFRY